MNDVDARQCLKIVGELPSEVSRRVLPYLALFRPQTLNRSLPWPKALRLLAELQAELAKPTIQWHNKVARPNTARAWAEAIEQIVQHPPQRLPLKNHHYLRAVAYQIADEIDRQAEYHAAATPPSRPPQDGELFRPTKADLTQLKDTLKQIRMKRSEDTGGQHGE